MTLCKIPNCPRKATPKGYCRKHLEEFERLRKIYLKELENDKTKTN